MSSERTDQGVGGADPLDDVDTAAMLAEAVEITADLIRIESVNTGDLETIGDGETRVCRRIAEYLSEVGIDSELVESRPGRGSLVARFEGTDAEAGALVVHGHVDVVPAAADDWSVPPFSGEIRDGWLYGRGAVDMKDMLGMMLAAVRAMRRAEVAPRRTLILAFFADEEHAGTWGAKWLAENRPDLFAGATHAMSEVGGFSVPLGGKRLYPVATAEKGVAWGELTAKGTAGHASMPTADNAVARLVTAMARVAEHEFPLTPTESVAAMARQVGEILGTPPSLEGLQENLGRLGHLEPMVRATLSDTASVTVVDAGYKVNVIPTQATGAFDGRVLPGR
uniref:M20/M25/M40 family metallo-hydrolase n=1 Tax=Dietzia sp. TaxID=1871616 RepID=UPI002FD92191